MRRHSLVVLLLIITATAHNAYSADATLSWHQNTEPDLAGYQLYYGELSGNYTASIYVGNQTSHTISGLGEGKTYYFSVTALDAFGNESGFSGEVSGIVGSAGVNPLFFDDFYDGDREGDPDWAAVSGKWSVDKKKVFVASAKEDNVALVESLGYFFAGRLESKIKISRRSSSVPNGGIILAYQDELHYRYVQITSRSIIIGQVGDSQMDAPGAVAFDYPFKIGVWHTVEVDVFPGGVVEVFLDDAAAPVASYAFAGVAYGKIGYLAYKTKTHFDDFAAWGEIVLP